jgi:serine/threonine-protein kinase
VERLGRYELVEELGRGAMGVVYKARDPQIDRLVAIKVMLTAEGLDPGRVQQWRERFHREARAAGRLAHPNIVTIHDVGEDQGRAFLVMEFIEGQTLDGLLEAHRTLPLDQVVTIGEQVAHALDYAHRQGIVHRDIKPANILLTEVGVAKVTDFGIARFTGARFTQTGHILGTPSYMSPEQIAGLKVDGRSDIFSLGAVLYELLTGEKAFPGETLSTITYRIIHEDPTPIRRLNPAFPAGLDACLKKALAKDPARRYAQSADVARDLRAATESRPPPPAAAATGTATVVRAAPATVRPGPARPQPAPRWPWWGVGGAVLAGLALAAGFWLRTPQRAPSPLPAPSPVPAAPADAPPRAEDEAQRKAEADRLAAERQRIEEEKARLAQQQAALEAERRRAAEEMARQKAAAEAEARRKAQEARTEVATVNRFLFTGNTVFSSQELEAIVRDHLGQPVSPEGLQDVAGRVTRFYVSRGFVAARAYPRPRDIRDGVLPIEVAEGRIGRVRVEGFARREALVIEAAFGAALRKGIVEKAPLRIAVVSLMERHRLILNLSLQPGSAPGTVDLVVQPSRTGQLEIELPGEAGPKLFPLKRRLER